MALGAKTLEVYDDDDGVNIEVTLWVNRDGDLSIGIADENLRDTFPVTAAVDIADAIQELSTWAESNEGKAKIAELHKKEQKEYGVTVLRQSPKRARKK